MKAVIYHAYDDIRLEDVPVPSCASGELLIQVHGCGLCGSDILKIVQQAPAPVKLGHELTGTIVECGQGVESFAPGQRVMVAHHVPCGTCHYCRHGNFSMCAAFKNSNIDPCGFAEYVRVPAPHVQQTTLALPEALSAEEGSFVEPLACCVRAVQRTALRDGDSVVVVGLGSIGLLMVQALKGMAARVDQTIHVSGIDLLPERLRMAGTINLFAAHTGTVPLDLEALYQQELTLTSTYSSSPAELPLALDLLASRLVRVDRLISHRLPLERFTEGVALMRDRVALKVYFTGASNKDK